MRWHKLIDDNKETIQRYYLTRNSTWAIPVSFIASACVLFLQRSEFTSLFHVQIHQALGHIVDINPVAFQNDRDIMLLAFYYGMIIAPATLLCFAGDRIKSRLKPSELEVNAAIIDEVGENNTLPQQGQLEALQSFINETASMPDSRLAFVIGDSGIGKTTLIKSYIKANSQKIPHIFDFPNLEQMAAVNVLLDSMPTADEKSIIVLDQFERALLDKSYAEWVRELLNRVEGKQRRDILLLLICKNESFAIIFEKFEFKTSNSNIHFIKALGGEQKKKEEAALEVFWRETVNPSQVSEGNIFQESIKRDYLNGMVKIIELNIVKSYLAKFKKTLMTERYWTPIENPQSRQKTISSASILITYLLRWKIRSSVE